MISISKAYFAYINDVITELGYVHPQASEILALDASNSSKRKNRISFEHFVDQLNSAGRVLKDPHIGLHVAQNFRISTFSEDSKILAFCQTIEDAATLTQRYSCLVHTIGKPILEWEKNDSDQNPRFHWVPTYDVKQKEDYRQVAEYIIGNYVLSLNWLSWGFKAGVKKITFMHAAQEPIAEYKHVLGCDAEFNAPDYSIVLDHGIIDQPLPTADAVKLSLLQSKLESLLRAYNQQDNLALRVEQKIREYMPIQRPTLSLIAPDLGLGERTLKRNLKDQGTSFGNILSTVKKDLCSKLISEGLPFGQVADLLWYSDQSAFTRAYKKWYGVSPSQQNNSNKGEF